MDHVCKFAVSSILYHNAEAVSLRKRNLKQYRKVLFEIPWRGLFYVQQIEKYANGKIKGVWNEWTWKRRIALPYSLLKVFCN